MTLNHLPECGTKYRGCAPDCPKRIEELKLDSSQPFEIEFRLPYDDPQVFESLKQTYYSRRALRVKYHTIEINGKLINVVDEYTLIPGNESTGT